MELEDLKKTIEKFPTMMTIEQEVSVMRGIMNIEPAVIATKLNLFVSIMNDLIVSRDISFCKTPVDDRAEYIAFSGFLRQLGKQFDGPRKEQFEDYATSFTQFC
jgi:hypothetical protein